MTVIVGIENGVTSWLGSDRMISAGQHTVQTESKIWEVSVSGKKWLIGAAGDARSFQLVEHLATWPEQGDESPYVYLITKLVPTIRTLLKEAGQTTTKDGKDTLNVSFLIGTSGELFWIDNTLFVLKVGPYYAIGSGRDVALGSLGTSQRQKEETPRKRIQTAIQLASRHVSGVGFGSTIFHT